MFAHKRLLVLPWSAVLLAALATLGCSTTPKPGSETTDAAQGYGGGIGSAYGGTGATTRGFEGLRPGEAAPWEDPANPLYQRIVYFDYDTSEIKPEYVPLLRTHGRYLSTQNNLRVVLEGHTDERGSREYNLALGEQRAESVRRFMVADGVPANQVATVSYGEERPADPGRTEAAWRQNRRVVIQY